jgi:hypothetical protein
MKYFVLLWLSCAAWGQSTTDVKTADQQQPASDPQPAADQPPPDPWFTGSVDVGYRWRTDIGGNENVYRSMVDLGSGPKLFGGNITILDPKHRWFDRLDVTASNWGDEPYTSLTVAISKRHWYDFRSSYRNLAYFNNLPTFANPTGTASQQTFDTRSRLNSFDLTLLPGNWIVPYFSYDRASGYGTGVNTFVAGLNESPVPFQSNFFQNNMRAGVRLEQNRYHATVEVGGTTYRDDQAMYQAGTPLPLTSLTQAYGVRGDSVYVKFIGSADLASWVTLSGEYLYTQPENDTNYQQFNTGNFTSAFPFIAYTSQQYLLQSAAKVPHTTGDAAAEFRLHRRVRLITGWAADRVRVSGNSTGQDRLSTTSASQLLAIADSSQLNNNDNHLDGSLVWDALSHLTLRGGYRYEWGEFSTFVLPPEGLASVDMAAFRRHVGKGGFSYRPGTKFSLIADMEVAGTKAVYFRTSPYHYQKERFQASYLAAQRLTVTASFSAIGNHNPTPNIDYSYFGWQASAALLWNMTGTHAIDFQGAYTRSSFRSDIKFLVPQTFQQDESRYRDYGHSIQGMFDLKVPFLGKGARLSAGGNFFISSGSRPTRYFQPTGKLIAPFYHGLAWITEWSYYGYAEPFYVYEGFRTHLVSTGIRFTKEK